MLYHYYNYNYKYSNKKDAPIKRNSHRELKTKFLRVVLSSDEKNTLGQISESVFLYIIMPTK